MSRVMRARQERRKSIHRQQVEHDDSWSEAEDHGNNILERDVTLPARRVASIGCLITHGVPHGFVRGTSNKPQLLKVGAAR